MPPSRRSPPPAVPPACCLRSAGPDPLRSSAPRASPVRPSPTSRPGSPYTPPGRDGHSAPGSTPPPAPGRRPGGLRLADRLGCGDRSAPPGQPAPAPGSPSAPTPRGSAPASPRPSLPAISAPRPSPAPSRCSAGTTAPRCARSRHGPARRTSGAREDFLRSPLRGGWPAYRAAALRRSAARRSARLPPAAVARSTPWAGRTAPRCTAARWRVRSGLPPPSIFRARPAPTPACFRTLCVPVPPGPSRSGPRARCNRSWRGLTALRSGSRNLLLGDTPPRLHAPRFRSEAHRFIQ